MPEGLVSVIWNQKNLISATAPYLGLDTRLLSLLCGFLETVGLDG